MQYKVLTKAAKNLAPTSLKYC